MTDSSFMPPAEICDYQFDERVLVNAGDQTGASRDTTTNCDGKPQ
ncbi:MULTISPECIES: hypothetical protein [Paraburkholderia]|uniref:Uncharacterized protein n=1 Tax=Paraburkholderia metrosideri TaxID=580937 RepID=A0ABW9E3B1_9BURK